MRYHFNIIAKEREVDADGVEVGSLEEAARIGVRMVGDIIRSHPEKIIDVPCWLLEIADAGGVPVFTVAVTAQRL